MIYLDSSAIIKLAIEAPETGALRVYLADHEEQPRVTSDLAMVEVPRAVARSQPLGLVAAYQTLRRLKTVPINPSVLASAASLPPISLRSLDAIHLASALALQRHLTSVVSYDLRLVEAARHAGLPAAMPK